MKNTLLILFLFSFIAVNAQDSILETCKIAASEMKSAERQMNLLGYVSHEIALQEQKSSQVLLLIEINSPETKCIIPGKLFEYMVSERPILALGPVGADFEQIIKFTNILIFKVSKFYYRAVFTEDVIKQKKVSITHLFF